MYVIKQLRVKAILPRRQLYTIEKVFVSPLSVSYRICGPIKDLHAEPRGVTRGSDVDQHVDGLYGLPWHPDLPF